MSSSSSSRVPRPDRRRSSKSPPHVADASTTGRPWGEAEEEQDLSRPSSGGGGGGNNNHHHNNRGHSHGRSRRRRSNPDVEPSSGESGDRPRRHERRSSISSSVHSASSQGSNTSPSRKKHQHQQREQRRSGGGGAEETRSRVAYSSRTREHRERRVLDDTEDSSVYSGRSGRSGAGSGAAIINHEDEIERIREMRARRLRSERLDRGGEGSRSKSPVPADSGRRQRDPNNRERLRDREQQRGARSAGTAPSTMRSTPLISRRELEDAGLVRKERRPRGEAEISPKPNRSQSDASSKQQSSTNRSKRDLSPKQDSSSYARRSDDSSIYSSRSRKERDEEDLSTYSRARRDRSDKGTNDDDSSAYSRVRRERTERDDEDVSKYSRSRRGRDRGANNDDDTSAYSRARRERAENDNSDVSAYTRSRKERERSGDDEDASQYSRSSADSRFTSRRTRRHAEDSPVGSPVQGADGADRKKSHVSLDELRSRREEMTSRSGARDAAVSASSVEPTQSDAPSQLSRGKERHAPARSTTGGEDLQIAARDRQKERCRPPARSKSADQDLLSMDLKIRNDDESKYLQDRESRKMERQQRPTRSRSTDLTTRLRERREARAAEREASTRGEAAESSNVDVTTASSERSSEDGKRHVRRRSEDDALETMEASSALSKSAGTATKLNPTDKLKNNPKLVLSESKHQTKRNRTKNVESVIEDDNDEIFERIPDLELSSDEEGISDGAHNWSVRMRVVSAVDLPLNVVPNMPLCPILKVGLVRIPADERSAGDAILQRLGNRSIETLPSARVRATTSKILSKRDNGNVDFHQELRWDRVKHPMQVALCIELCARAVRTPKNFKESPPSLSQHEAFHLPAQQVEPTKNISSMAAGATAHTAKSIVPTDEQGDPVRSLNRNASGSDDDLGGGLRALWRKATNRKAAELEAAEAAAAVARMLIEQDSPDKVGLPLPRQEKHDAMSQIPMPASKVASMPYADYKVTLRRPPQKRRKVDLTEDVRLGFLVIPLTTLPLDKATNGNEAARVEQWFQLETMDESIAQASDRRKKPSVLLEISFSSPDVLDESEDELENGSQLDEGEVDAANNLSLLNASFSRRSTMDARGFLKDEKPQEDTKLVDPVLQPGVIDFITIVGCQHIGDQKNDDGAKGWVDTTPECTILECFPPNNELHKKIGRKPVLTEMVQWFSFPEGSRLWRGTGPPSHTDLNLKRFSASSPPNVASSIAAFDACLNCTTSFTWFVIASNSDEYGSRLVKTYGAVIRFYAPAPVGIDPKQEDFAQAVLGQSKQASTKGLVKRLWVPIGICLTSSLPIVGVMEAMLLRLCENLASTVGVSRPPRLNEIHKSLTTLIATFQRPIAGAVNCSVPFLSGDRFLLSLPPPTGLPALPHGRAVVSVCRLLGAEGLNYMLAAILTEGKILIHSQDVADIAMVAEVVTALTYPFSWSLPYIPILPVGMLEFVDAPLSYLLGVPTCSLSLIDPRALEDVMIIDLDNGFSSADYFERRRASRIGTKNPTPLPASVATNISKAVYRLLRAEEEVEEEFGSANLGEQSLPRVESESLAERECRVSVAIEVCGLLRGYEECVGPVFNRDKFLKIAPALFEDRRDNKGVGAALGSRGSNPTQGKIISPRSKRFLSLLVNTQNFQQFLEMLESDDVSFFHEIMSTFEDTSNDRDNKSTMRSADNGGNNSEKVLAQLVKTLQKAEDKIPTYRVDKGIGLDSDDSFDEQDGLLFGEAGGDFQPFHHFQADNDEHSAGDDSMVTSFTDYLLAPIDFESSGPSGSGIEQETASIENMAKLEASPWEYRRLLDLPVDDAAGGWKSLIEMNEKVNLRDAIGERRYRAWKMAQDQKAGGEIDLSFIPENLRGSKQGAAIDLTSLITSAANDTIDFLPLSSDVSQSRLSKLSPEQQKVADAKDRDVIRRCLDRAHEGTGNRISRTGNDPASNPFMENRRDLIAESEKALRSLSAQRFLLSILAQRSRLENQRVRTMRRQSTTPQSSVSRLDSIAFECLIRLSCAMLDACLEYKGFEPAYRLLTYTAGFITLQEQGGDIIGDADAHPRHIVTMTSRVGLHPIFADLGVWETVMALHLQERQSERKSEIRSEEETEEEDEDEIDYEAAVATLYEMVGYGIPGEELSRFAMRASEEHGWFCDDRGRQLLMLARRICIRRDQADLGAACSTGDIEMVRKGQENRLPNSEKNKQATTEEDELQTWVEIGWCHPAAPSSRNAIVDENSEADAALSTEDYMKRSPVTALASFGSSVVVSGGLDGSVFLAHSINTKGEVDQHIPEVHGIHLDWGSASRAGAGSSSDGEYGVGAVCCLAAANGSGNHGPTPSRKDTGDAMGEEDLMNSMEGSRVVAGTTAGDLRVWSVKDVYTALLLTRKDEELDPENKSSIGGSNALTRLKFSLRGRALSGHRGGVTCIDVPSHVYRPDALVTGGADGLIKLWSLRAPTGGRRPVSTSTPSSVESESSGNPRSRGGDAISTLSGHNGRIMCITTAWHGDKLLSGGADRTLRVWDVSSSNGKCLHTLSGHFGWITHVQYWGPNTIISASTDRSVALWDARVKNSPLFMLRHHHAPISDLLVGSRTDPMMVSAAADGTVAAWDFRTLSNSASQENSKSKKDGNRSCRVVRHPAGTMSHGLEGKRKMAAGPVQLARGVRKSSHSIFSIGSDAIAREWRASTGELLDESPTGHCDAISSFHSYVPTDGLMSDFNSRNQRSAGTLTSSWDGTIRMRILARDFR